MHLSQPALSHAVAKLEAELGVELFVRLGRGIALTPAGEVVEAIARDTLRDVERLQTSAAEIAGAMSGRLQLTAPRTLIRRMAGLVGAFRSRHPGVVVELADAGGDDQALEALRSGRCDMALVRLSQIPLDIRGSPLEPEEFVAVFPPGTELKSKHSISMDGLVQYPLIAPPRRSKNREIFDEIFFSKGLHPTVVVESAHPVSILELVAAGAGACLAPRDAVTAFIERGVVMRRLEPRIIQEVHLVHRIGRLSPAALAFERLAVEPAIS